MNLNDTYSVRASGIQHGDVFTKPNVVRFMLDEVGYVPEKDLSSVSIMEPSCGNGEFLMEIVHRLKLSSITFGFDLDDAYKRCVYASDIDAEKVAVCSKRISAAFPDIEHPETKITVEDYLLSNHKCVDIIVGNPPYIRYEEIPQDKLAVYKKFPTFYYRSDIFVPFFEKSLSELNQNGKHCFICSNRWIRNRYGKKLRRLIADYYNLEKVVNMESADAFLEKVLAYPAITLITNNSGRDRLLYTEVSDPTLLTKARYDVLPMPAGDDWSGVFNHQNKDILLIEDQGFKIGIGVATGADSIFISNELKEKIEEELLLPVINSKDLSGDVMFWPNRYMLNPYDINGKMIDLDLYPLAKAYLESHKVRLAARHKARKNPARWYATIDNISPNLKNSPKILLPDISANRYIFVDDGKYYPQHNVYYKTGKSLRQLKILAAILMSEFARSQLSNLTNHMNGGYARWQSQYLRKLRVPDISLIPEEFADKLLSCYEERDIAGINRHTDEAISRELSITAKKTANRAVPQQLSFAFDGM